MELLSAHQHIWSEQNKKVFDKRVNRMQSSSLAGASQASRCLHIASIVKRNGILLRSLNVSTELSVEL